MQVFVFGVARFFYKFSCCNLWLYWCLSWYGVFRIVACWDLLLWSKLIWLFIRVWMISSSKSNSFFILPRILLKFFSVLILVTFCVKWEFFSKWKWCVSSVSNFSKVSISCCADGSWICVTRVLLFVQRRVVDLTESPSILSDLVSRVGSISL